MRIALNWPCSDNAQSTRPWNLYLEVFFINFIKISLKIFLIHKSQVNNCGLLHNFWKVWYFSDITAPNEMWQNVWKIKHSSDITFCRWKKNWKKTGLRLSKAIYLLLFVPVKESLSLFLAYHLRSSKKIDEQKWMSQKLAGAPCFSAEKPIKDCSIL